MAMGLPGGVKDVGLETVIFLNAYNGCAFGTSLPGG